MTGSGERYCEVSALQVIKYWLLAHFPSFAGKKQEADELSGDASVEDDAFVKVMRLLQIKIFILGLAFA